MTNISMTPKQRRFVDEYLIDLNATQAAIRAGYSEKTARFIGGVMGLNFNYKETDHIVGFGGGYTHSFIKAEGAAQSKTSIDSYHIHAYGKYSMDNYYLDVLLSVSFDDYEKDRIALGGLTIAKYDGNFL